MGEILSVPELTNFKLGHAGEKAMEVEVEWLKCNTAREGINVVLYMCRSYASKLVEKESTLITSYFIVRIITLRHFFFLKLM